MRTALSVLLAAILCSCIVPLSSGGTGGTDTDGGDTGACKSTTTCADCTTCALNGPCASLYSACAVDANCAAVDQCFALCGADAACKQQCIAANPAGASAYSALLQCVNCDQCAKQCAGLCG